MTDFAPQSTEAVANLKMYYNDALVRIEERLEIEPDGDWVTIANVRRAEKTVSNIWRLPKMASILSAN